MHTEYLVVNDGGQCQIVKHFGAVLPHIDRAVFAQALVVKAVHLEARKDMKRSIACR